MSRKKGGFVELFYGTIMPKIYGIGASVVILGAMFKILHLGPANLVLTVGLTTEAIIFFLSAFEPAHKEIEWSKVYPELDEDYTPEEKPSKKLASKGASATQEIDKMMADAKIEPKLIKDLGDGFRNLSANVKSMGSLADAAGATNEYASNVKKASGSLTEMNKSYASTMEAMKGMSTATKDTQAYQNQVQVVTKNLSTLNSMYELELKDANNHLKNLNKFYENMTVVMKDMADAGKSTTEFKTQVGQLTNNLTQLNTVYGNMLSAMKG